jgi:hypothetical protein
MQYVICDIDGVLAHRPVYLEDGTKTEPYDYSMIGCEEPDRQMERVLKLIPAPVILLTGRREHSRESTDLWLDVNFNDFYTFQLRMKPDEHEPYDSDIPWKLEAVGKMIKRFGPPLLVIDDNPLILNALREEYDVPTFLYSAQVSSSYHW